MLPSPIGFNEVSRALKEVKNHHVKKSAEYIRTMQIAQKQRQSTEPT
jgi:ribulose bisphosphate carboxylase small subunit